MTAARPLVPPEIGCVRFDLGHALWLWGMLLPGAVLGLAWATPGTVAAALVLFFLTMCAGHSVGLHRGVIHRTYEAGALVRGVLLYLFVLTGLGGPLAWARLHAVRDYWQNDPDCPPYFAYRHALWRDFFWNLHLRFEPADDRALARLPAGVFDDRWLRFLEHTWPLHVLGLALLISALFGPEAVAVCVCARTAASMLGHWVIGYVVHRYGERRYEIAGAAESGTNVWVLGVISFGEGFHNNHHAFPGSARMGLLPHEWDAGWLVLKALRALGLVRALQSSSPDAVPLSSAPCT